MEKAGAEFQLLVPIMRPVQIHLCAVKVLNTDHYLIPENNTMAEADSLDRPIQDSGKVTIPLSF